MTQPIDSTRRYFVALVEALGDCGHTPANVLAVLREYAGALDPEPRQEEWKFVLRDGLPPCEGETVYVANECAAAIRQAAKEQA